MTPMFEMHTTTLEQLTSTHGARHCYANTKIIWKLQKFEEIKRFHVSNSLGTDKFHILVNILNAILSCIWKSTLQRHEWTTQDLNYNFNCVNDYTVFNILAMIFLMTFQHLRMRNIIANTIYIMYRSDQISHQVLPTFNTDQP